MLFKKKHAPLLCTGLKCYITCNVYVKIFESNNLIYIIKYLLLCLFKLAKLWLI